jgi:outer membrane protein assembly factor BamB
MNAFKLLGLLFLCLPLTFLPAQAQIKRPSFTPSIQLSTAVAPPTTKIRLVGTNFLANETVNILFDNDSLSKAAANPQGKFSAPLVVPQNASPGEHQISAVGKFSRRVANANLLVQTDWPKFHFDLKNSGYNRFENVLNVSNVSNLSQAWTSTTDAYIDFSSPAVVAGVAYIGSGDGKLYAFNAASGGPPLWSSITGGPISSSPAVAKGLVYVAGNFGKLYAFNATTGDRVWTAVYYSGGWLGHSSPAVANGMVYIGSPDGKLYAFDARTGAKIWANETSGKEIPSCPAVANGMVYVGSYDGHLYAFNAATGDRVFSAATTGSIHSSPAVSNGMVFVGTYEGVMSGKLYAFNAVTGAQLWTIAAGNIGDFSSPGVANGVVYVGGVNGWLYAFDAVTGASVFSVPTRYPGSFSSHKISSSPAVANGVVYVADIFGNLFAFNAATGDQLWAGHADTCDSSPAVANGVVYFTAGKGLYAFRLP